jgi:NADH-quinone oxidoreductase subunit E
MIPSKLKTALDKEIAGAEHPREMVVDVMSAIQDHYGYLSDEALEEAAALLNMNPCSI